jgi:hypothetical protein
LIFDCQDSTYTDILAKLGMIKKVTSLFKVSRDAAHSDPSKVPLDEYKNFFPTLTVLASDYQLKKSE